MHASVNEFKKALIDNSEEAFGERWEDAAYVSSHEGYVTISDNYERFFSLVYKVTDDGEWFVRGYDQDFKPYTQSQAMQDASIMYTG